MSASSAGHPCGTVQTRSGTGERRGGGGHSYCVLCGKASHVGLRWVLIGLRGHK